MKVLVTGGAGFIGRYVCEELESRGHIPLVMDIAGDEYGDVRSTYAVEQHMLLRCPDAVIHLAAILGTQETIDDPVPVAMTNLIGSLNVLEAACALSIPVVYAAVGNSWMRGKGTGAYTITKTCVEDFIEMYNQHRGGRIAIVRPVNAYGPRQSVPAPYGTGKVRKIMVTFVNQALHGDPIEVYGDGSQISDMVYVTDVARAFVDAIGTTGTSSIGPLNSTSVQKIARMVRDEVFAETGNRAHIVNIPMRRGEVPGITRAYDKQPTFARVGLHEGILRTVEYYRSLL